MSDVRAIVLSIFGVVAFVGLLQVGALIFGDTTPKVFVECGWFGEGRAFVDENRNGTWDGNEPPLAGVRFLVKDKLKSRDSMPVESVSDGEGHASLHLWLSGCPETDIEVYSEPPAGYTPSTAERISAETVRHEQSFTFGFVPQE